MQQSRFAETLTVSILILKEITAGLPVNQIWLR